MLVTISSPRFFSVSVRQPYFTHWDPSHYRRNAFVGTYQATTPPVYTCPTVAQVQATNETERWVVWDQPSCATCRLPCTPELMVPCCVKPLATSYPPADPSMGAGTGPAWAMARAAFWGAAMILFGAPAPALARADICRRAQHEPPRAGLTAFRFCLVRPPQRAPIATTPFMPDCTATSPSRASCFTLRIRSCTRTLSTT